MAQGVDNILLMFEGDFLIENVIIDCRNVRTGIWLKSGCLKLINCTLLGEISAGTKTAINVSGNLELSSNPFPKNLITKKKTGESSLQLTNCIIKNFVTGIHCLVDSKTSLSNTIITNCLTGLECDLEEGTITVNNSKICNNRQYGFTINATDSNMQESKKFYSNLDAIKW